RMNLRANTRKFIRPRTTLTLKVLDESGSGLPARVSITDNTGRFYAPEDSLIYADDGFDRSAYPFETHYFHKDAVREVKVSVPFSQMAIDVSRGYGYHPEHRVIDTRTRNVW